MSASLIHRGPDDAGFFLSRASVRPADREGRRSQRSPDVGLAMRRLAIIDLEGGRQPIANEEETCWIVFNGEIYNHIALRRVLQAAGHVFRTESDTEAILHAYEEYGLDCVRHLRGMFAFAIWDARRERLLLARDPVGIKPLYWWEGRGRLLFASEIKALLQDRSVPRRVNREGLHHYLSFLYVPPPQTMFEEIQQLPPGHRLLWERGQVRVEEYWRGPGALLEGCAGPPMPADRVWEVLRESVAAHMISDVPLGAFLSGGLDSSAIVAAMAELSSRPVKTFSIGFRGAGLYNELAHARQVARHLGTDHEELVVGSEAVSLLPEIVRHLDEPLADASVIPNYMVARLARRSVTVALTGIGGDELFGGYRRYFGETLARTWQRVPGRLRRHVLLPALRRIPAFGDTALGEASRLAQKFLEPLDLEPEKRYLAWNVSFTEAAKRALYARGAWPDCRGSHQLMLHHFQPVGHRPFADRAMYVDLKSYLPGDPLFLSDRMTMANSLEARVPFVDPHVMELAARIPLSQKIQGRNTKAILRRALAGRLPQNILERPKRGFGTPIDLWLRGELAGMVERILSREVLEARRYFRPEYVAWLREQQAAGRHDFSQHLWALLTLELWHRVFIDEDLSARPGLTFEDLGLPPAAGSRARLFSVPQGNPAAQAGASARDRTPLPRFVGAPMQLRHLVGVPSQPCRPGSRVPTEWVEGIRPAPQPSTSPRGTQAPTARVPRASPAPLRILMVADVDPLHVIGGAERVLHEHSRRLAARGHHVAVLTRREDPERPAYEVTEGVHVYRHGVRAGSPTQFFASVLSEGARAYRALRADEPFDVVNAHQPLAACAVMRGAGRELPPVVYTFHSAWAQEYATRSRPTGQGRQARRLPLRALAEGVHYTVHAGARNHVEHYAVGRSRRLLALSRFSAEQLQALHGVPASAVKIIPGGVDTDRFRPYPDRAALRARLGLPVEAPLLLTVRNLVPRMGLEALIEAMRAARQAFPDLCLVIGGTGPLTSALRLQVAALGLEACVRFAGFIPEADLPGYYAAADLFILPTRCLEGFGLITVESLACGTPVVGTPVGAIPEVLGPLDPDLLFAGTAAEAMAEWLLRRLPGVLQDEALRERCRQYAVERYAWESIVDRLEALFHEAAGT